MITFNIILKDGRWLVNGKIYIELTFEEKEAFDLFFKHYRSQKSHNRK